MPDRMSGLAFVIASLTIAGMSNISRRAILSLAGAATALPIATTTLAAVPKSIRPSLREDHQPVPLPFDPAKLDGLSERLITSHWENNYIGSVKALNMISGRIKASLADKDMPALVHGGLKREHLHRSNSITLHEYYFGQLGGNGKPGGDIAATLAASFGTFETWERDFRRTAMSLAGGSGWCVLAYNRHLNMIENYWATDHMMGAVTGVPLLVLDMYEHSFQIDYGAAAAKYVDAFMRNVDWEIVDKRFRSIG